MAVLAPLDSCVSPVLTVEEVTTDAHWVARDAFGWYEHPDHGWARQVGPLGDGAAADRGRAPARGASDSAEVLADAGLSAEEVAALRVEGAIQ
jgi:crotonobetainyl-CoA:carnitine CoA-transferase CaiB-like acyl-CoA transferase